MSEGLLKESETIRKLMDGLSPLEVRALAIEALRRWWRDRTGHDLKCAMHDGFGRQMAKLLAERRGVKLEGEDLRLANEPFLSDLYQPWLSDVVEFVWWLFRAGFAVPSLNDERSDRNYGLPTRLAITRAGQLLLQGSEDHPALPHFLARIEGRCPGIPDQVKIHLTDAQTCVEHGLARPAIVLMGLAYEAAIDEAVKLLAAKGKVPFSLEGKQPWEKIKVVRANLGTWLTKEPLYAAEDAWGFADTLRRRRNDGSHRRELMTLVTFPKCRSISSRRAAISRPCGRSLYESEYLPATSRPHCDHLSAGGFLVSSQTNPARSRTMSRWSRRDAKPTRD